jgi:hypothetical protein
MDYENESTCLTCPEGYGFQIEGTVKNCIKHDIPNCVGYDKAVPSPFACTICASGFYVNDLKLCSTADIKIEFCLIFKDTQSCARCQSDMAISPDGKYCYASPDITSHVDANCSESYLSNEPLCNTCAPGYYFDKNNCVICENNMALNGCMYCDPENPDVCLMCLTNFYMNNKGVCVKVPPVVEVSGASILKLIGFVFGLVIILHQ